ncbi:MAG: hypothetical protein IH948_10415, partial [Bacteroidetes bacterium]|nr:hypothetical protein [Bacteroidota bacterium]
YLRLTKIILETNDNPAPFFAPLQGPLPEGFTEADKLRTLRSFQIVKEIESKPVANPLEIQYFSAAPFLFGADRVMKFSAKPVGGEKQQILPEDPSENYLHESLIARMGEKEDVCFDFKIQVRNKDETGLDIEDATAVWDEGKTPFINVAKIVIQTPQKNIDSPKNIKECEELVFTPWHSLAEHQPLGGINRLRKEVYLASKSHRDTGK